MSAPTIDPPVFDEPARRTAWRLRGHDVAAYNIAWIGWVLFHASPAPMKASGDDCD